MLEIVISPACLENYEIRNREIASPKAKNTHHYVAKDSGAEVGFIALDVIPGVEYLVLYEIFIPHNLRKKGIGTKLLAEVERLAAELGYRKVTLKPEPFEQDYPKSKLVKWYKSQGYREMSSGTGELEKVINR